jgi:pyruvate dehydrogenase E2 component (dihydrolipoamide acetyltransferase)
LAEILRMPEIAANTESAILASWNVELNASYAAGDVIATVETDKAVVDVEAEADGVLLHLVVGEGVEVEVGSPIAVWGAPGETVDDVPGLLASLGIDGAAAGPAAVPPPRHPERIFASPLARKAAREAGLALAALVGTGPRGGSRGRDVDAAVARAGADGADGAARQLAASAEAAAPSTPLAPSAASGAATFTDVPNSRIRQAVARRLTESKQTAPHFYLRGSARVDRLLALRRELNAGGAVKVSVNDLIVKAVARAHTLVPALNVIWNGDSTRHFTGVDVAVAVATEHGLVTPVVRGVDRMGLEQLVGVTQDLIARAKERRLQQSELEGGSISVTNLGMYGTEEFAAIINPPHAAILAVGAAREEPVVQDGALAVGTVLRVTLAVDHRPVDGAAAAEWMRTFLGLLEHPAQILL